MTITKQILEALLIDNGFKPNKKSIRKALKGLEIKINPRISFSKFIDNNKILNNTPEINTIDVKLFACCAYFEGQKSIISEILTPLS